MKFLLIRRRGRRGAVVLLVLAALLLGVLLGWGGFSWWGGGGGSGSSGEGQGGGAAPPREPATPEPQAAGALRVTQEGVVWNGETVPFTDLQRIAELIAKDSEDQRVRVIYAADVDHLNEKRVQDALQNVGVKEILSHEKY